MARAEKWLHAHSSRPWRGSCRRASSVLHRPVRTCEVKRYTCHAYVGLSSGSCCVWCVLLCQEVSPAGIGCPLCCLCRMYQLQWGKLQGAGAHVSGQGVALHCLPRVVGAVRPFRAQRTCSRWGSSRILAEPDQGSERMLMADPSDGMDSMLSDEPPCASRQQRSEHG